MKQLDHDIKNLATNRRLCQDKIHEDEEQIAELDAMLATLAKNRDRLQKVTDRNLAHRKRLRKAFADLESALAGTVGRVRGLQNKHTANGHHLGRKLDGLKLGALPSLGTYPPGRYPGMHAW